MVATLTRPLETAMTTLTHLRNVAIIAHVDHGRTRIVDGRP
jgi:translation elongation factor EF-4